MSSTTYVAFEIRRTFRNKRFLVFSLGFPLLLFLITAGANRDVTDYSGTGISLPLYFMVGMAAWGAMAAELAGGARIAAERQAGWLRQLRLTPLTSRTYFSAKILGGYGMALLSLAVLFTAGVLFGVRMEPLAWVRMTALMLIGLIPFAVLGILLGHMLTTETMGPAIGGLTALLALLGGSWGPAGGRRSSSCILPQGSSSHHVVQCARSGSAGHRPVSRR